jgi:hypothetical protein
MIDSFHVPIRSPWYEGSTDVNVSPDKRIVFVHHEENLIEQLKVGTPFVINLRW